MAKRKSAHAELADLDQRIRDAKQAERQAEVDAHKAAMAVEHARDAAREAHDVGADATDAMAAIEEAKAAEEAADLAHEGVAQRVRRVTAERDRFVTDHGDRLIEELQPACEQVVADIAHHAAALMADHARWHQVAQQVASYLRAMSLSPAENAPGESGFEPLIRDLKRLPEPRSPYPHFGKRADAEAEQRRVAQLVRERNQNEVEVV